MSSAPSIKHWALLLGVAAIVGGLAGWLGSRAGAPAPQPTITPTATEARATETATSKASATVRASSSDRISPASPRLIALPPRGSMPVRAAGPQPLPAELPSVTNRLSEMSDDDRVSTVEALLKRGTAADKWDAINVLAATKDERAYDIAHGLIRDKDVDVATGAANVLTMGPGLTAEDVSALEEMMNDTDIPGGERAGYNAAVMSAMRMDKAPGDFVAFTRKALHSDASEVRGSAVANVVTLPSEHAVPFLVEALSDENADVANGAFMALVHAHGGDEALGKDPSAWQTWWDKKQEGGDDTGVLAVPPLPDDVNRAEASAPELPSDVPSDPPLEEAAP